MLKNRTVSGKALTFIFATAFFLTTVVTSFPSTTLAKDNLKGESNENDDFCSEETLMYDDNGLKMSIEDFTETDNVCEITFHMKNNSDKNLSVDSRAVAINRVMLENEYDDNVHADVAAWKKATGKLKVNKTILEYLGFTKTCNLDLLIRVTEGNDYYDEVDVAQCSIDLTPDENDEVIDFRCPTLYEKNDIVVHGLADDEKTTAFIGIENRTDSFISCDVQNITINDLTMPRDSEISDLTCLCGCTLITAIEPTEEFLTENDIYDVDTIDFSMKIRPEEDYLKEYGTDLIHYEMSS